MTIYWYKCDICGKYKPVEECTVNDRVKIRVCASCYITLSIKCRENVWRLFKKKEGEEEAKKRRMKEIEDLLSMLE